ncbi:MAG: zinc metalloprotease HtpX [Candidatus Nanohaloarchaeota archaeon QJJ-9]|nr:zinc metalloprotease HtpX [Candidatus Nanohaloarchaeota archaeon QJJ-9]
MGFLSKIRLTALFAVLVAVFGAVGLYFGGASGMVLGLIVAGAMNFVSYFYSDKMVVKMHRAEALSEEEAPEIHSIVEKLSEKAGIPKPKVYAMDESTPNAFATGRKPSKSIVCVTSGLISNLSKDEVEGVLAHELSHIKNRDTLIQTVAGTLAGAISIIAHFLWFSTFDNDNQNPLFLIGAIVLAPLAASMIKLAISRSREFSADSSASKLTEPEKLASALESIESSVSASRKPMKRGSEGTSHLYIVNPFRKSGLAKLFSTHPPTEERIERLRSL